MTVQITPFILGDYQTNCYVVTSDDECWVVDCGYSPESLIQYLLEEQLQPKAVLLTHCHSDHIAGLDKLRTIIGEVPVLCHEIESKWNMNPEFNLSGFSGMPVAVEPPTGVINPHEELTLGNSKWEVLHTPGHSPGSLCFVNAESKQAIVGDTLFAGSIGRHDFPTSNVNDLRNSIHKILMGLPDEMTFYPGHGPSSTIGHERHTNPFVVNGF